MHPLDVRLDGSVADARQLAGRHVFDVAGAIVLLLLFWPLLPIVALLIKAESRGPLLHGDTRIGQNGRTFTMYKFRSMRADAAGLRRSLLETNGRPGHPLNLHRDPRLTRVGRLIRRFSVDELPQIFNVLRRDMSLVGPRPLLIEDVEEVARISPEWKTTRQLVLPGLTGPWQIRTRYEVEAPVQVMIDDDIDYVERRSLSRDVRLLAGTALAVLCGKSTA